MADILESVRRDFLGSKSANQYDYIRKDMDVIGHPVERYRPIIDDILKSEKSYTFDEIKEKFMDLKENTMDKVEKNTPENSTADSEKSESGVYRNHLLYFRDKWLYKEEEKREKAEEFPKGKKRYQKNGSRNLSI